MTLIELENATTLATEHAALSKVLNPSTHGVISVVVMVNGKTQHTFDGLTCRTFLTERLNKVTAMLSGMGVTI